MSEIKSTISKALDTFHTGISIKELTHTRKTKAFTAIRQGAEEKELEYLSENYKLQKQLLVVSLLKQLVLNKKNSGQS